MKFAHETVDLSPVQAAVFAGALVILVSAVLALTLEVFRLFEDRASVPPSRIENTIQNFPEPRLQVSPREDLLQLQAREHQPIESYAWVDRGHHIARMPVDQAIGLALQNGLPSFPQEPSRVAAGVQK